MQHMYRLTVGVVYFFLSNATWRLEYRHGNSDNVGPIPDCTKDRKTLEISVTF